MALTLSESFAAGIPGGFATVVNDSGTLTVTYNAGQQAVDLSKDAFNAGWRIDAVTPSQDMRVILDLEQVTADNGFGTASGFGVSFKSSAEAFAHTVLLGSESQTIAIFRGSTGAVLGANATEVSTTTWVEASGRNTWEISCIRQAPDSTRRFTILKNGVVVWASTNRDFPYSGTLTPYVFLRDSAYRLHAIDIHDSGTPGVLPARGFGTPAGLQAFAPTWPVRAEGRSFPPPVYRHFWGGVGRIVGTTKIKGAPDIPVRRRVRLIREVDGVCVQEVWSDATTGAYEFRGYDPTLLYTVIVYDGPRVFRAAVQDAVTPEVFVP